MSLAITSDQLNRISLSAGKLPCFARPFLLCKSSKRLQPPTALWSMADCCITNTNIELALLSLDLCEEAIQIAKVRHVSWYARYASSDLLYRRSQLWTTAPRYEDVRAFVHKLLRRRKANAAIAASNECNFPFKLPHGLLLSRHFVAVLC